MNDEEIKIGDRIRWRGLSGHEGTVVALGSNGRWVWVEYDDGGEKDAYISELELIK